MREIKKLWFENNLWKVEKKLMPTKYDRYFLCSRVLKDMIHGEDDKTTPIHMTLIDIDNDDFYPDTAEVRKLMQSIKNLDRNIEVKERKLSNIQLELSTT